MKTGNDRVDAIVVDEDAIGSLDKSGCGAKILRGNGALEGYLARNKVNHTSLCKSLMDSFKQGSFRLGLTLISCKTKPPLPRICGLLRCSFVINLVITYSGMSFKVSVLMIQRKSHLL